MIEALIGVVQSVYTFILTNLGLKADAADSSGTVLARLKYTTDRVINMNQIAIPSDTVMIDMPTQVVQSTSTAAYVNGVFVGSFVVPLDGFYKFKAQLNIGGTTGNAGYLFNVVATSRSSLSDETKVSTFIKVPSIAKGTIVDCTTLAATQQSVISSGQSFGVNTWGDMTDQIAYLAKGTICSMYVYRTGTATTLPGPGVRNIKVCFNATNIGSGGVEL